MSVLDVIGETPLFPLTRITAGLAAAVHLKAEFLNPGGSVKDRAALAMVRAAAASGELKPGGVIVEGTSGNTGIGLAMVAAQGGYRAVVVVPDKSSTEKIQTLRAYAYLSKYFDDGWLRRSGFPAPPVPGPLVGDLPASEPVLVPASGRVSDLAGAPVALLLMPRAGTSESAPAPGDITGSVPLGAVSTAAPDAPLAALAQPPLPTVGAGESVAEALARIPADAAWLAVLTDGRVTGVLPRTTLDPVSPVNRVLHRP